MQAQEKTTAAVKKEKRVPDVEASTTIDQTAAVTQDQKEKSKNQKSSQKAKLKARIQAAKQKLEKERMGGELPGDYIAAQEAKINKMERKLAAMIEKPRK